MWELDEIITVTSSHTLLGPRKWSTNNSYYFVFVWHRQLRRRWILRNSCNIIQSQTMLTRRQEAISNQRSKPLHHCDDHQNVVDPEPKDSHCPQGVYNPNQMTLASTNTWKASAMTENCTTNSGLKELKSQDSDGIKTTFMHK